MGTEVINLGGVERELARLGNKVDALGSHVSSVESQISEVRDDLAALRNDFLTMMEEQRRASALEQAATELVSVRQEMERKFGNYGVVRNTMVGILQATDAALVRKATISTVSEELMISTPDYWLAPVLVALAAWINNNRDLAERAIAEAVRRDNEHSSLAMALICRRNHRTGTCYEWLARYFSTQNAAKIDMDSMVYIDAYVNGIFGPDEKHLCDDYMTRWIGQIQSQTPQFEEKQSQSWAEYFRTYETDGGSKYPALKAVVKEFGYIDKYLGKINAIEKISTGFEGIRNAEIDSRTLAEQVDSHLMELVNSDDPKERQLREEEEYLLAVKACEGDVTQARRMVNQRRQEKREQTVSIVEQMTRVARDKSRGVDHHKKTALRFLGGYINDGFARYRDEETPDFPQEVTLELDGWSGRATTGDEAAALKSDYATFMEGQKAAELAELQRKTEPKNLKVVAMVCAVAGIVFFFINATLGIALLLAAAACFMALKGKEKARVKGTEEIAAKYGTKTEDGAKEIDLALGQWKAAKAEASERGSLLKMEKVA
ncbi:hypothetical protein [Paratractidigestivibacter faecalis]|uniref:hypothetical protein n=1 Tax=Paratractidigestivibacter faecalis TaxID=2292441 RepID=UPI00388D31C0